MELKNKFTEQELKLLKEINIEIIDKEYTIEETGEIIEKLDNAIRSNLDDDDEFTSKALDYEKIQDKVLEYEDEI